jgi:hypothetical protein
MSRRPDYRQLQEAQNAALAEKHTASAPEVQPEPQNLTPSERVENALAADAAYIQKKRDENRTSARDLIWNERQLASEPLDAKVRRVEAEGAYEEAAEKGRVYLESIKRTKSGFMLGKTWPAAPNSPGEEITDAKAARKAERIAKIEEQGQEFEGREAEKQQSLSRSRGGRD